MDNNTKNEEEIYKMAQLLQDELISEEEYSEIEKKLSEK